MSETIHNILLQFGFEKDIKPERHFGNRCGFNCLAQKINKIRDMGYKKFIANNNWMEGTPLDDEIISSTFVDYGYNCMMIKITTVHKLSGSDERTIALEMHRPHVPSDNYVIIMADCFVSGGYAGNGLFDIINYSPFLLNEELIHYLKDALNAGVIEDPEYIRAEDHEFIREY